MKKEILLKNNSSKTTIIIKNNYIEKYLELLTKRNKKVFCIIDDNLKYVFYKNENKKIKKIFVKSGEEIKTMNFYNKLSNNLLGLKIDRESIIVAIGGGTIGDVCGFISSTLLRGIKFNLIPSTLLSQVDSAIGGKNGINTVHGKNLIGTFYQPNEIVIDISILKSLPIREVRSGYAEIIKYALIKDKAFFKWLDKNYLDIFKLNSKILEYTILKSIMIKIWYVKKDQKENLINKNSRAMLNFGHSIGHALEAFYSYNKKLNHGEAISIGMIIESKISNKLGHLSDEDLEKILNHFKKAKLPEMDKNIKNKKIFDIILKDKKNSDNKINLSLVKSIGKSFFARNIKIEKIKNIINKI